MIDYELKDIDSEDIEDLLVKAEKSFDLKFGYTELVHLTTFGQLCDHIAAKIQLDNSADCTSQQAFYKLRDAISATIQIDKKSISTNSLLEDFLPLESRRLRVNQLEEYLGFKLNILRPPDWVTMTLGILLLASFFGFGFNWQVGLAGLIFSLAGFRIAYQLGNELDVQTVGQVAEKMTRENYLKSRRNSTTFNKKEINEILTHWFGDLDSVRQN